ncbi:molybdate ABC transporter substrate-binding protein [Corynebacterium cystitidis]|uniref:Molybdate transport system substrate-binding protein n=1 Tax=Corynebacterium cystitidis DSM 20524 TaxID=1121357 RepID=A0A1H9S0B8_9CORY|nr:molybdate ABC transporter substrate-binding protein [Corynebacterium cystitidis]WJY82164.1 Molybdate-binding periplasmic protein precursor [Corynebacterium cystitidis DSM 20524]SER78480.1 molybdate transport system substrate-binding protein [Corynebacterium cystitidis DSM 20524]SNV78353.1 putative molybdate transport system solute-binding protein [Corynebacterium cystitidis]
MFRPARLVAVIAACGVVVTSVVGCASPTSSPYDEGLTVLGASSTRVINEVVADYAGTDLEFVNAGSSTLVQQLADGADGDVLITADRESMQRAHNDGTVTSPQVVASNTLVMVVPAHNPANITSVTDLNDDATVVFCDPQVPCGAATEDLLAANELNVTADSLEHAVADVLGKVISGEADAGWVYRTDALAAGEQVSTVEIPHADDFPNEVMAAVTTATDAPAEAESLVQLLVSPEFAQVWQRFGFTPVAT